MTREKTELRAHEMEFLPVYYLLAGYETEKWIYILKERKKTVNEVITYPHQLNFLFELKNHKIIELWFYNYMKELKEIYLDMQAGNLDMRVGKLHGMILLYNVVEPLESYDEYFHLAAELTDISRRENYPFCFFVVLQSSDDGKKTEASRQKIKKRYSFVKKTHIHSLKTLEYENVQSVMQDIIDMTLKEFDLTSI